MHPFTRKQRLLTLISVLILVSIACGTSSGGSNNADTPDFEGTAAALEATADAISNSQSEPPTQAPSTDSGNSGDSGSTGGDECVDSAANYSSGDVVLSTEFDDAPCWGQFQIPAPGDTADYNLSLYNSALFFEIFAGGITAYATWDPILDFTDVHVYAGVNTLAGPNTNNISLICRGTDLGWYEFSMTSGGEWLIWKVDTSNPDDPSYEILNSGFSNHYLKHTYNHIAIACEGDLLELYIEQVDGEFKLVGSASDRTYQSGQVAVSVYSYPTSDVAWNYGSEPMEVEFDYLEIQIP